MMWCAFSLCEFYNIVLGGIIIGIITSILFTFLTSQIEKRQFLKKYKYLASQKNHFDWLAYSMRKDDGRLREDASNGSTATISVKNKRIQIILEHTGTDKRKWMGELQMISFGFGIISLKYTDKHEYDKRDCIIGSYLENGEKIDYLFLTSTRNKVYVIKKDNDQFIPEYNYDNEILVRERI